MADRVKLAVEGRVAVLTLARPDVLNAIDRAMCDAIIAALDEIEAQEQASVLVIAGEGRSFCAGADLKHMRTLAGEMLRRFIERTWIVGERINRSPLLSIAAVHGFALGGGAELALGCDMRLVEKTAAFGFPEMTLGSVPGSGGMQRLHALVGPSRALELVMEGTRVAGPRAVEIGLANRVVEDGRALPEALEWARALSQRPAEAIRYAKTCIRLPADGAIAPMVQGLVSSVCQSAKDYRANAGSFLEDKGQA
ncbi:MAG TPA: enoyl-CoA hydratase/isomerase family protein [Mesorhizobium sp.]|jgi:enoyl-CoA hydratase/carnithine racemase